MDLHKLFLGLVNFNLKKKKIKVTRGFFVECKLLVSLELFQISSAGLSKCYIFVFYLLHTNLYFLPDTTINVGPFYISIHTAQTSLFKWCTYVDPFLCSLGVVVNECMEDPSLWRAHTFQCIILVPECILYIHFYFDCCKYEKTWYKKFEFFCKKLFEIAHEFLSILLLVVTGFWLYAEMKVILTILLLIFNFFFF